MREKSYSFGQENEVLSRFRDPEVGLKKQPLSNTYLKGERQMLRSRHVLAITVVLVVLILGAYQLSNAPALGEDSGEKFVDTVWAYEEAFQAGEVDRVIEFYAPDAVSLPPGYPPSVGREAIEADLTGFFGEFDLEREFDLVDYEVAGDNATRLGEWTQTLTPKAGGDPIVETGRCVLGWRKINGEWKVVWEIWNTY